MDTLLQDLRSALQALGEHPAFTLAAAITLGFGVETGAVHTPPPHARTATATVPAPVPPRRAVSWMDYIDFRGGSGDVLRWIGTTDLTDTPAPRTCGAME